MKKLNILVASMLLAGNFAFAEVSKNSPKSDLLAEIERLKSENQSLKSQITETETEVQSTKVEMETVKTELSETQKKVPVVEPGHERDNRWINFNLVSGHNMRGFGNSKDDTYGEIEVGGRKGIFDFYGYIDFSDIAHSESSDKNSDNGSNDDNDTSNFFSELTPRISLNGLTGKDLSIGPVKEWYIAGYLMAGDSDLWTNGIGIGSDWDVPWLGVMPLNLYALYVEEDFDSSREGEWNGYLAETSWFKPLHFFENGSFLAFQGYINYLWDTGYGKEDNLSDSKRSDDEFQWYNGLFWHFNDYAFGYGLKYSKDMAAVDDSGNNDSTGFEHYFTLTYKL